MQELTARAKAGPPRVPVIFEINDDGREYEYGRNSGDTYINPFYEFLLSLGLDIRRKHPGTPGLEHLIVIDGVEEFVIDTASATYKARNAFNRDVKVRAASNRYAAVTMFNKNVVKVFINKEHDANQLRRQINAAVAERKELVRLVEDKIKTDEQNMVALAQHYSATPALKRYVDKIFIENGLITFWLKGLGAYIITPDGRFNSFSLQGKELKTSELLREALKTLDSASQVIDTVAESIARSAPLTTELQAWVTSAFRESYNVTKMKYATH